MVNYKNNEILLEKEENVEYVVKNIPKPNVLKRVATFTEAMLLEVIR